MSFCAFCLFNRDKIWTKTPFWKCNFSMTPLTRVADPDPAFLAGSGSGFQIFLDPDPVCPERLDQDPVNIRPGPKPSS